MLTASPPALLIYSSNRLKMKFNHSIFLSSLFLLSACGKGNNPTPQPPATDQESPVLSIRSPVENAEVKGSSGIPGKADISDNDGLHEVYVKIVNTTNAETLFEMEKHSHANTCSLDTVAMINAT